MKNQRTSRRSGGNPEDRKKSADAQKNIQKKAQENARGKVQEKKSAGTPPETEPKRFEITDEEFAELFSENGILQSKIQVLNQKI